MTRTRRNNRFLQPESLEGRDCRVHHAERSSRKAICVGDPQAGLSERIDRIVATPDQVTSAPIAFDPHREAVPSQCTQPGVSHSQ